MIAAVSTWHDQQDAAASAVQAVRALPSHVLAEAYAVLTRMPRGLALEPSAAADLLNRRFPEAPLRLDDDAHAAVLTRLADSEVSGGATYDGLVALEAAFHDRVLLTLDRRALAVYQRLGVSFRLIQP